MNQATLAFDRTISHNVGTRVFESAAMGCLPLWSESGISSINGMSLLMKPWEHYVPYFDTIESLNQAIDILLSNKKDVEYLRNVAKKHVLEKHTYAHRCMDILKQINIQMEF
jgi:spore maturation protein CgeB